MKFSTVAVGKEIPDEALGLSSGSVSIVHSPAGLLHHPWGKGFFLFLILPVTPEIGVSEFYRERRNKI